MCLSCGCGQLNESHGDPRNITLDRLQESAAAANISPEEAARNIRESMEQSSSSGR